MSVEAFSATRLVIESWRNGRPIVPFLGSGVSLASGFPTIKRLTAYLAKVRFALDFNIYESRYPLVTNTLTSAAEHYRLRPSSFLTDFGWPDPGQLTADIWSWLTNRSQDHSHYATLKASDVYSPDNAVQYVLNNHLSATENDAAAFLHETKFRNTGSLNGDWTSLLLHLTEGHLDLVDSLFSTLEHNRAPTRGHLFLSSLVQLLGIRLVLSTNFDTLFESALRSEGIAPRVYNIHRDSELPCPHLVREQLSLVNLHGSAYGLRFGERLDYALNDADRDTICDYLPERSLLLVIGFSGWERRMSQLIHAYASERASRSDEPQVLWLATPESWRHPSPFLTESLRDLRYRGKPNAITPLPISDANSFFPGLFTLVASTYPATRQPYSARWPRPNLTTFFPKTPIALGTDHSTTHIPEDNHGESLLPNQRGPYLLIIHDIPNAGLQDIADSGTALKNKPHIPSGWPSLAADEITHSIRDRDVIWIDLETFYTVNAVVAYILNSIKRIDPLAPQLSVPLDPEPEAFVDSKQEQLLRPVERIREALQRGRYLLVFDSIESFSKPHHVHHGFAHTHSDEASDQIKKRIYSLQRLLSFLRLLMGPTDAMKNAIKPPLCDSIILLTVAVPSPRHALSSINTYHVDSVKAELRSALQGDFAKRTPNDSSTLPNIQTGVPCHHRGRADLKSLTATVRDTAHQTALSKLKSSSQLFGRLDKLSTWITITSGLGDIRRRFQTIHPPYQPGFNGRLALLAMLSFFRRPRSIAAIRPLILRWTFDPGADGDRHKERNVLDAVDKTLAALTQENLLELCEGQQFLIPRCVHERVYDAVTSPLRLTNLSTVSADPQVAGTMFLCGLIAGVWHMQAARVYFADIYIPSRDDNAFFEYVYHRISALRYLAIVQYLLDRSATKNGGAMRKIPSWLRDIDQRMASLARNQHRQTTSIDRSSPLSFSESLENAKRLGNEEMLCVHLSTIPTLIRTLTTLGLFSFVRHDDWLRSALSDVSTERPTGIRAFSDAVYAIRLHGLTALTKAIQREHLRIQGTANSDTWISWIQQLVDIELPKVLGDWRTPMRRGQMVEDGTVESLLDTRHARLPKASIKRKASELAMALLGIQVRLYRANLQYVLSITKCVLEIDRVTDCHLTDGVAMPDSLANAIGRARILDALWQKTDQWIRQALPGIPWRGRLGWGWLGRR